MTGLNFSSFIILASVVSCSLVANAAPLNIDPTTSGINVHADPIADINLLDGVGASGVSTGSGSLSGAGEDVSGALDPVTSLVHGVLGGISGSATSLPEIPISSTSSPSSGSGSLGVGVSTSASGTTN